MPNQRIVRVNEMMRREIALAVPRLLSSANVDLAAVTVTHVDTSPNLRQARVFISILGHEAERADIMAIFKRHRVELQSEINRNLVLKYTPRLSFHLDLSLEKGDRVLHLLDELDTPSDPEPPAEDT